jgi:hypothetical protein
MDMTRKPVNGLSDAAYALKGILQEHISALPATAQTTANMPNAPTALEITLQTAPNARPTELFEDNDSHQ